MSVRITIIGNDPRLRSRCETALQGMPAELVVDQTECDVALIVSATDAIEFAVDVATILVADSQATADPVAFDGCLPVDFTDRELHLACQLAARLTAERRALAAARKTESSLREQVETDPLTGLANRRSWDAMLLRSASQCLSTNVPLVLVFLDLDRFKQVNSDHGYSVGDRVLSSVGRALAAAIRNHDVAARIGGDEFGLLLPGLPRDRAASVVERIRLAVCAANSAPVVTASAGFSIASGGEETDPESLARELFELADRQLRVAKSKGGDATIA